MKSGYLDRLTELPGPVWAFGAYVVYRLWEWGLGQFLQMLAGSWWLGGGPTLLYLIPAAGVALAVCVLWGLIDRSSYGLSLARWYAGLQVVMRFVALFFLLFSEYDPHVYGGTEFYVRGIAGHVAGCVLWFLFLRYLEQSEALRAVMPEDRRDLPWWGVAVLAGTMLFGM